MVMNTIFIQIASYRDSELIPTIKDCISKAKYPGNLSFGICWQHSKDDDWDNLDEFTTLTNFTIMDVPWKESRVVCWARSHLQQMWKGEKYTLQLDSHHRFIQHWDQELIEMVALCDSEKPIITSYVGAYEPTKNVLLSKEPYKLCGEHFNKEGNVRIGSKVIENFRQLSAPIRGRFVSGHFYFTLGKHCQECLYDPEFYFDGEELRLSILSYTNGYDIFHPHKLIIWHEYTRKGRVKHWDDFDHNNKEKGIITKEWHKMNDDSCAKLRGFLNHEIVGSYGLPEDYTIERKVDNMKTLSDYEKYAGIHFKLRKLHPDCVSGVEPPVIYTDDKWITDVEIQYNYTLTIPPAVNFKFIFIGVETDAGELLFRKDLTEYVDTLVVNFKSIKIPYKWIYWVYDREKEWDQRIDTLL